MELTIEQALQQGVAAHREGKLQEAERLYRAILQSQPAHPDANHNLGVLAVSVNKAEAALPLFKTALEANPKIEQFWLSYIDALVKEKQFENAKQVFEQAKIQGVAEEKLNILEAQLTPTVKVNEPKLAAQNKSLSLSQKRKKLSEKKKRKKATKQNLKVNNPPQQQLSSLLEYYQNGRFDDAEKLAVSITQEFPKHQFGWKVLGAVLKQTGKLFDSLTAMQKSVQLAPQDAEAHNNLGVMLQELGRFAEAQASYMQAIALKSEYAEAHNNLGVTLQELGRLEEAEASYNQAIALKPDYAEACSNLGNMLQELERLDEAEASYNQVIALKPENIEAHTQLLMCLFLQDKKSVFFDELDYLINQDKADAITGSLACRSALKYGLEKPNLFCTKPLNYVLHNDLNARYDFEKIFLEKAKSILNENRISNRRQILLVNGNQTSGNIFDIKNDDTNEIQNIIRFEVERYQKKFKKSEEGFIKKMPAEYSLHGWLISMKSGGNLKPHIHTEGWLSGSIYINVPRKLKADNGKLVLALGEESDATDNRINEKIIIDVVTGSIVLFPSSLMHYTIPFESEEERIVLAFDVKEK